MDYTLASLASSLGLEYQGRADLKISHVCGLTNLSPCGLGYLTTDQNIANVPTPSLLASEISKGLKGMDQEVAIIVKPELAKIGPHYNLIFAPDPLVAHVEATKLIHPGFKGCGRIHETAVLGDEVEIGEGVTLDPYVVIYDRVKIGSGTFVGAGTVIMPDTVIGEHCQIFPKVVVREQCTIGHRVVIHAGAVVGADGHGYFQRDGQNFKLPQVGGVIIEDDVELGSCTTIDRGRLEPTIIGSGSKLDNQVQIGHNVQLGAHALISAQTAIGGSTKTGHHLILAGQSGIRDHMEVGDHVTAVARTAITRKTKSGEVMAGMPSRTLDEWKGIEACLGRLPGLFDRMKKLEQSLVEKP